MFVPDEPATGAIACPLDLQWLTVKSIDIKKQSSEEVHFRKYRN